MVTIAMLMVVFGAGASYDSFPEHQAPGPGQTENSWWGEFRPPLARELFEPRFAPQFPYYGELLGLFPQLDWAAKSAEGVEVYLDRLATKAEKEAFVAVQLLGLRFYLSGIIGQTAGKWNNERVFGATNYAVLLDRIDAWRRTSNEAVVLATFNYDTLLDDAVSKVLRRYFPIGLSSGASYVGAREYKLLKLHGSTNWFRTVRGQPTVVDDYSDAIIRFGRGELELDSAGFATQAEIQELGSTNWGFVPAIAVPVQAKARFECPSDHESLLVDAIKQTTKLLIVGWKGMEQHFLRMWEAAPRLLKVLVVDVGDGGAVAENQIRTVAKTPLAIPFEHVTNGFSNFVRSGSLEQFLAS